MSTESPFNLEAWFRETNERRGALIRQVLTELGGELPDAATLTERVMLTQGFSRYEGAAFGIGASAVHMTRLDASYLDGLAEEDAAAIRRVVQAEDEEEVVVAFTDLIRVLMPQVKDMIVDAEDS